ncbi:hypothetical protein LOD99_10537 [Oopsacas minuta]|uniref:Uncharacterized protein n=1 Tax=Oopsacas minuta TaxID=111878 RepID=A0AAV7KHI1_9METZ|nr:hypothetical protein LOD99_10537 [Oopsacas minuta]
MSIRGYLNHLSPLSDCKKLEKDQLKYCTKHSGKWGMDVMKKKAKEFQTQYASLFDELENIWMSAVVENSEIIMDLYIEARLLNYVNQLEFVFICDKLQFELNKAREFLSQYECNKYQEYKIMSEHRKDIHIFKSLD